MILVYSDLMSRHSAMTTFTYSGHRFTPDDDPLADLRNGHPAASRFADDLAALRSLATASPPVTVQPANSRAAAEVLLLVHYVDLGNRGCDSRGGFVVTELPPIRWKSTTVGGVHRDGTIAHVEFTATLTAGGTWNIELWAC